MLAVIVGGVLVLAAASVPFLSFSSGMARAKVVGTLADHLDSEVTLEDLRLHLLPRLGADGTALAVRLHGRHDVPPLIAVRHFSVRGGILELFRRRLSLAVLDGLDIEIPPHRADEKRAGHADGSERHAAAPGRDGSDRFVIDQLRATDARVVIIPSDQDKPPKVWAIHDLRMQTVSADRRMPFEAALTNAVPPGEIETRGIFGPWQREDPGRTPLQGTFRFDRANLGIFKGISGILSAHGGFTGELARIDIHGETDTPEFTVATGGHPVPLRATYHTIVDGTNGNTILDRVDASFLSTSLVAKGAVVGKPGVDGRTVSLDVTMEHGRLEDVLRLAVKTPKPPMVGALVLTTGFLLPPGDEDVVQKLRLDGRFTITGARFTKLDIQKKIDELSHRSRGQTDGEESRRVASTFSGAFKLAEGTLTIPTVTFDVPGAAVQLAGTYNLVTEMLDFRGTLFMDAKVSQTVTGFKHILLKVVDPLFRRDGGGSAIPIKITGNLRDPSFGLDTGRLVGRH
jgi:hypothetical protein